MNKQTHCCKPCHAKRAGEIRQYLLSTRVRQGNCHFGAYQDTPFTPPILANRFNSFSMAKDILMIMVMVKQECIQCTQYFKDMSFEMFSPQFDVYGPVTLHMSCLLWRNGCRPCDESLPNSLLMLASPD
ncbi:MAG: hypothetical protein ACLRV7_00405 [Hoylesella buccalis]